MLNMFRTLIHPSSGACDFSIVSPHWLCFLISMCVGVSVWLVGVVSVWQAEAQLQPATRIPHQPATPKLQHLLQYLAIIINSWPHKDVEIVYSTPYLPDFLLTGCFFALFIPKYPTRNEISFDIERRKYRMKDCVRLAVFGKPVINVQIFGHRSAFAGPISPSKHR